MKNETSRNRRLIERKRRQDGITIITLVVTIILLIILTFTIAVNISPYFEERRKTNLETEISNLQAENLTLSQVPASVCVGYDEYDQPIYEANEPAYSNAQAQIAANNKRIEDILQPALEETIRLINKINKFMNEVLPAINQ